MRFGDNRGIPDDYGDDMLQAATDCRHFSKRNDMNSFNMINYESCENCSHFTSDYTCGYRNSTAYRFDMS